MNSFLLRSNSSHLPTRATRRPKTPGADTSTTATPSRALTPGPTSLRSPSTVAASPSSSAHPPRPKSTLGFSSKFGLAWKNSLKSSTSTRPAIPRRAEESPTVTPSRVTKGMAVKVDGAGVGGKAEGGIQRLRRKVSTEWWAAPAGARPSTPASTTVLPLASLQRPPHYRQQQPRPRSWATTPLTPSYNTTGSAAPATPIRTPRVPLTHTPPSLPPLLPVKKPQPETPRTKAVHLEWRAAARELEGDWKECLLGAVCISIVDPLEGIKDEYMQAFSPRFRPAIKLIPTPADPQPHKPTTTTVRAPTPTTKSRSALNPSTTPTPTPRGKSKPHLGLATKSKSPIPISSSPTPRPRAPISPTPLTRRPLVSRRTVDAPRPPRPTSPPRAAGTNALGPRYTAPVTLTSADGITPRSARRMRNSLKMTPLPPLSTMGSRLPLPVSYVPLKAPAESPPPIQSRRPATSPKILPTIRSTDTTRSTSLPSPAKSPSITPRTNAPSRRRSSTSTTSSTADEGTITPPSQLQGNAEEVMSPWQVVRPSPAFARRHEGLAADTEWVIASPLRRSLR